jgi:nucleoside-diphosphate-sugar epimerase
MDFFRKSYAFDGRQAQALLGWKPEVDLDEGMRATARWYREQQLL